MDHIKSLLIKWTSRKWVLTWVIGAALYELPVKFKESGVADSVTLTALGGLLAIAVNYHIANVKDAKPQ